MNLKKKTQDWVEKTAKRLAHNSASKIYGETWTPIAKALRRALQEGEAIGRTIHGRPLPPPSILLKTPGEWAAELGRHGRGPLNKDVEKLVQDVRVELYNKLIQNLEVLAYTLEI